MSRKTDIYGEDWDLISNQVKAEVGYKCEKCSAVRDLKKKIRLTTHHKDGNPANNNRSNLECLCNRCHLDKQKFIQAQYWNKKKEDSGQGNLTNNTPIIPQENTRKI
jgi:5-methylcytosine-specific restriction endonuclease McrA